MFTRWSHLQKAIALQSKTPENYRFRVTKLFPYFQWRTGVNVLRRNSIRLAEVWMDDYAKYYYQRIGSDKGDFGDISARLQLREDLGCKSFQWYLDTIFPELVRGRALEVVKYFTN